MDNTLSLRTFQDYLNYSDQLFEESDRLKKERIRFETVALYKEMNNFIHNNIVNLDYDCELYTEDAAADEKELEDAKKNTPGNTFADKILFLTNRIWNFLQDIIQKIVKGVTGAFQQGNKEILDKIEALDAKIKDNKFKAPDMEKLISGIKDKSGSLWTSIKGLFTQGVDTVKKNLVPTLITILVAAIVVIAIMNASSIATAATAGIATVTTAANSVGWEGTSKIAKGSLTFLKSTLIILGASGLLGASGVGIKKLIENKSEIKEKISDTVEKIKETGSKWTKTVLDSEFVKKVVGIKDSIKDKFIEIMSKTNVPKTNIFYTDILDNYIGSIAALHAEASFAIIETDYLLDCMLTDAGNLGAMKIGDAELNSAKERLSKFKSSSDKLSFANFVINITTNKEKFNDFLIEIGKDKSFKDSLTKLNLKEDINAIKYLKYGNINAKISAIKGILDNYKKLKKSGITNKEKQKEIEEQYKKLIEFCRINGEIATKCETTLGKNIQTATNFKNGIFAQLKSWLGQIRGENPSADSSEGSSANASNNTANNQNLPPLQKMTPRTKKP